MRGEDLTGLMFAQLQVDNFYSELGDGQVMDDLNNAIVQYNADCCNSQSLNLILFRRAIEHITRLCRVMVSDLSGSPLYTYSYQLIENWWRACSVSWL